MVPPIDIAAARVLRYQSVVEASQTENAMVPLSSYLPWPWSIFASLLLRSSLRTAAAELPTFSTVRCKSSLEIPKCTLHPVFDLVFTFHRDLASVER
jgi:hypothetical protein